jgi:putative membrane protein
VGVRTFITLALIPQFGEIGLEIAEQSPLIGTYFVWATIPFYVIVARIFHTTERMSRTGENLFEGTTNDVPISTIARGIEIDLRQN